MTPLKMGDELYRKWVADTHREYGDIIAEKDSTIPTGSSAEVWRVGI